MKFVCNLQKLKKSTFFCKLKNFFSLTKIQAILQNLFEQIWAANEFEIFKRMMIQKNLELQLQALNMIEQKYGLTPASLTCGNDNFPDDEIVMEQILKY